MFRVSGQRTPLYAALRPLPMGIAPRQPIHRYLSAGKIARFADVEFLAGGSTLERDPNGRTTLYDGLPPYMAFSAPSGFLGRQIAQQVSRAQPFPESLKDWSDEHRIAWLFTMGLNLPGNLVFGSACLQREMELRAAEPVPEAQKLTHYVEMAQALKAAAYGSSAGGEQPKFLSFTEGAGHVLVKFAKRGSRMADLLPLEHLALRALATVGVPSAPTQLLLSEDHVFLEVVRFDREGTTGRVGMLSAGAVDDEFFGKRDTWPEFAARCLRAKYISAEDAAHIDTMAAFSELIGNTDRHFENLSLLIDDEGEYQGVAPAYDILPMRYAPIGGGIEPDLNPIEPKVGTVGARPEIWSRAAKAAGLFWHTVQVADLPAPVSTAMRQLAARNLDVVRTFLAPLVPDEVLQSALSRRAPE
ncbi:HipA domain-containing protein [Hydrogenophaga intermedia]|uniref:HipA domain-containing protein n=1 Tax=Hydrogenophaga intermedia TaxID=65786 RepID=UPI002042C6AA|nr:HipA domain-containing protein [Hydrogenophaga intermedia]MCM3565511.1 HipA domain-containing protein [Hydrogenophaga intermedia]